MAWKAPSILKSAISLSLSSTHFAWPGAISSAFATLINSPI